MQPSVPFNPNRDQKVQHHLCSRPKRCQVLVYRGIKYHTEVLTWWLMTHYPPATSLHRSILTVSRHPAIRLVPLCNCRQPQFHVPSQQLFGLKLYHVERGFYESLAKDLSGQGQAMDLFTLCLQETSIQSDCARHPEGHTLVVELN